LDSNLVCRIPILSAITQLFSTRQIYFRREFRSQFYLSCSPFFFSTFQVMTCFLKYPLHTYIEHSKNAVTIMLCLTCLLTLDYDIIFQPPYTSGCFLKPPKRACKAPRWPSKNHPSFSLIFMLTNILNKLQKWRPSPPPPQIFA